uniref:YHS domain-containing protein n=1 Tax=Rhodopseudomonas palustris (strain BisA53) TaxID=316055 RepID=Q07IM3_RHOP5
MHPSRLRPSSPTRMLSMPTMTVQRQQIKAVRRGLALILLAAASAAAPIGVGVLAATTERVVVDRHNGLAIGGFDPVAYFTDQEAVQGKPEVEAFEGGVVWRFCNAGNRDYFLARPDIYAPQFGGYDPVDVARGVTVSGNARVWLIAGRRLYLFAHEDNRAAFSADPARYLVRANQRWPKLVEQLAQ